MSLPQSVAQHCAPRVRPRAADPIEIQVLAHRTLERSQARDISVTGAGIFLTHGLAIRELPDMVELIIALPHQLPFVTSGRVVHRSRVGEREFFGVEFVALTEEQSELIRSYIALNAAHRIDREHAGSKRLSPR